MKNLRKYLLQSINTLQTYNGQQNVQIENIRGFLASTKIPQYKIFLISNISCTYSVVVKQ